AVLILRSAHAQALPRSRTRVRASRRMRTCDWVRPHASRCIAAQPKRLFFHLRCDAPQHEGASVKNQPAGVRNNRRAKLIVSGLLFTMTFCNSHVPVDG